MKPMDKERESNWLLKSPLIVFPFKKNLLNLPPFHQREQGASRHGWQL
jgi:hypothetical protein